MFAYPVFILSLVLSASIAEAYNLCNGYPNGAHVPNPRDCSSYYVCDHNEPALFHCMDRLLFDNLLGVCNWAQNVSCGQTGGARPPVYSAAPVPSTPTPTTVTAKTNPAPTPLAVTGRPIYVAPVVTGRPPILWQGGVEGKPENSQNTYGNPNNGVEGTPEHGLNYPNKPPPSQIKPTLRPIVELTPPTPPTFTDPPAPLPSFEENEIYPGLILSLAHPDRYQCSKGHFYFAPNPTNCNQYFICENYRLHSHQCGPGIHWDYIYGQCDLAQTAFCYGPTSKPVNEIHNNDEYIYSTELPQLNTVSVTNPADVEETLPEIVAEPIYECPENQAFMADPRDCHSYYICIGGFPIETSCPEKMAWDSDAMQCSDDANIRCLSK